VSKHVADIPKPFYCYVQNEFLYNFEKGFGEYTACLVYGLSAIPNRAWGLSLLLENGALVQHVPIHALTFNTPAVHHHPLDHLQVWSCYGQDFTTHEYSALSELAAKVYMKEGVWETGRYMFTAAPYGDMYSSTPDQHKHFNFVRLDCGRVGAWPGNRMLIFDESFVKLSEERPKYVTNTKIWHPEGFDVANPFDKVISPDTSL
jgi:hypothetical protein